MIGNKLYNFGKGCKMKKLTIKKLIKEKITDEQFKQIMEVEQCEGDGYSEKIVREIYLEDQKDVNFACFDGEKIVAHIATNPLSQRRNGSIFVVNLVVLPDYRRQGIGQKLIHEACKYYIENGYKLLMSISVDKDNFPAINLYKKVGFEIKDPICKVDEDDEQYIMDSTLENINQTIENLNKKYDSEHVKD